MDEFLRYWFMGFDNAIQLVDTESITTLLGECGKACSRSYPEKIYRNTFLEAADLDDFLHRLEEKFPELETQKRGENMVSIRYTFCACDLVQNKYISSPRFCECSRMGLKCNWEAILGEGHVDVDLLTTILAGADHCEFLVTFDHFP